MANLMNKFQTAAKKAGQQATAFSGQLAQSAASTSQQVTSSFTLEKECARAAATLRAFCADPSNPDSALNSIPKRVLQGARGLAIFTVVKAGMIWSGKLGSGLVIARLPDGSWSAPSCLGTTGVGFGFQVGADVSDFVIVLNSDDAVRAFATSGNMTIGGNLSAAVGPIGTGGSVDSALINAAPLFTYSKSKGLYAGVSLEGTVLVERKDANAAFYGAKIPSMDLLSGKVPPPEIASDLYTIVEQAEGLDESSVPAQAYVPAAPAAPASPQRAQPLFDAEMPHAAWSS